MDNTEGKWPEHVGILALEIVVPSRCVNQADLELHDDVSKGKYTIGLGQERMAFCSDREDVVSLSLTAVSLLMHRTRTSYSNIGRLEVGTETPIDKSKSIKSMLMRLFDNCNNVEGVDSTNACYGGTAALFNSIAWLESSAWDGRLAIVVAADVATYARGTARPTGGAGAVAMLLGPNAPLVLDRGLRASHMNDTYDFYKGDMGTNYPTVDGKVSIRCYFEALYNCYYLYRNRFLKKFSDTDNSNSNNQSPKSVLQQFDAIVFHSPYGKLVRKAFTWLMLHDVKLDAKCYENEPDLLKYVKSTNEMAGKRIAMFSFGSGMCSSFYSITIRPGAKLESLINLLQHIPVMLENRQCTSTVEFENTLTNRELAYNKAPFEPTSNVDNLFPDSWYLTHIDSSFKRYYARKK